MKLNIIAIYVVKLKAVLRSQFLTNLDKIWYVQVSTIYPRYIYTPNLIKIGSETKKFFPVFHIYCEIDHGQMRSVK